LGTVTAPKELSAIQEEIGALERHQRALEDQIIERMEAIEPLDAELALIDADEAAALAAAEAATVRVTVAEAEIDVEIDRVHGERDALVRMIDAAVVREYDALRARMSGIAVARLEAGSCRGCHLQLSKVELDRIRREPPDAVVHCEECGRILVR
jgi:predicted  nucleic acid-binding Zn-ribbon protein